MGRNVSMASVPNLLISHTPRLFSPTPRSFLDSRTSPRGPLPSWRSY
jgi:hypothetical protein